MSPCRRGSVANGFFTTGASAAVCYVKHGLNVNAVSVLMENLVDGSCSFLRKVLHLWRNCIKERGQM